MSINAPSIAEIR